MDNENEPTVVCENCDRPIPESKSFLHEAYCLRNIIRCPKCNEPIDKNERDLHEEEYHKLVSCTHCKKNMEKNLLPSHEETCTKKPKFCQFCNCEIVGDEFTNHVYQCGSRTKKCSYCNKNILVRDFDDHEVVCQVSQHNYSDNFPSIQEDKKESGIKPNPYAALDPSSNTTKSTKPSAHESGYNDRRSNQSREATDPTRQPKVASTNEAKSYLERPSDSRQRASRTKNVTSDKQEISNKYSRQTNEREGVPSSNLQAETKIRHTGLDSKDDKTSYSKPSASSKVPSSQSNYGRSDNPSSQQYGAQTNATGAISSNTQPSAYDRLRAGMPETSSRIASGVGGYSRTDSSTSGQYSTSTTAKTGVSGYPTKTSSTAATKNNDLPNKYGGIRPEDYQAPDVQRSTNPYSVKPSTDPRGVKPAQTDYRGEVPNSLKQGATNYSRGDSYKSKIESVESILNRNKISTGTKPGTSEKVYSVNDPTRGGEGLSKNRTDPRSVASSDLNAQKTTASRLDKAQVPSKYVKEDTKVDSRSSNYGQDPRNETNTYSYKTKEEEDRRKLIQQAAADPIARYQAKSTQKDSQPIKNETKDLYKRTETSSKYDVGNGSKQSAVPSTKKYSQPQPIQPSRNVEQDVRNFARDQNQYGADDDEELQRVLQESLSKGAKPQPSSTSQKRRTENPYGDTHIYGQADDDDAVQKAIEESLKGSKPSNDFNPNSTWNDESFKRILEKSKYEK